MPPVMPEAKDTNMGRDGLEYTKEAIRMQSTDVHLRVGQYPESYERTRFAEEGTFQCHFSAEEECIDRSCIELDVVPKESVAADLVRTAAMVRSPGLDIEVEAAKLAESFLPVSPAVFPT